MIRRILIYGTLLTVLGSLPNPVLAGTFSTSFPASFCQKVLSRTSPALIQTTTPNKAAYAFAQEATYTGESEFWCEVQFPRSVISATFTVYLTWETNDTTITNNVCWQAAYEVTIPGQDWFLNFAVVPAISAVTQTPVNAVAGADIRSSIVVVATDDTGTVCPTGSATGTCAGSHGMLLIRRSPTNLCASDSSNAANLERVEITGVTN
jgi:hypothetical protein